MARAARREERQELKVSSLLLVWSMLPLAAGLTLDFHLIVKLICGSEPVALVAAAALFLVFVGFWFVFPRAHGLHMRLAALRERRGHH